MTLFEGNSPQKRQRERKRQREGKRESKKERKKERKQTQIMYTLVTASSHCIPIS